MILLNSFSFLILLTYAPVLLTLCFEENISVTTNDISYLKQTDRGKYRILSKQIDRLSVQLLVVLSKCHKNFLLPR